MSQVALDAELAAPGSSSDAIVWTEVTRRAYDDSELNWTYISFMVMATLLAGIAIILDSGILTVGAMVLGPEFGAIAALGVALIRRRWQLLRMAARTLVVGFSAAILVTFLISLGGRWLGWVTIEDLTSRRMATDFIYHPDRWSIVVAVLAAAAGVLSLTSAKVGGLSGVFNSVTTIPAAGNVALGLAFGDWGEVRGSGLILLINIAGMAVAGWATLGSSNWCGPGSPPSAPATKRPSPPNARDLSDETPRSAGRPDPRLHEVLSSGPCKRARRREKRLRVVGGPPGGRGREETSTAS